MTPATLTFVLVHGAFQSGAIEERTARVLRGNGHAVQARSRIRR